MERILLMDQRISEAAALIAEGARSRGLKVLPELTKVNPTSEFNWIDDILSDSKYKFSGGVAASVLEQAQKNLNK